MDNNFYLRNSSFGKFGNYSFSQVLSYNELDKKKFREIVDEYISKRSKMMAIPRVKHESEI